MTLKTQPKVALISGITGQYGSYHAEFLLEKSYIVHGTLINNLMRIVHSCTGYVKRVVWKQY